MAERGSMIRPHGDPGVDVRDDINESRIRAVNECDGISLCGDTPAPPRRNKWMTRLVLYRGKNYLVPATSHSLRQEMTLKTLIKERQFWLVASMMLRNGHLWKTLDAINKPGRRLPLAASVSVETDAKKRHWYAFLFSRFMVIEGGNFRLLYTRFTIFLHSNVM